MKKTILILCIVGAVAFCSPKVSAAAISNSNTQASVSESQERTAGLITRCNLSVVSSGKNLLINGKTIANTSMQTIGYKNVVVEYSSNGTNWYEEKDLGDLLKSNSSSYYLNSYTVPVKGGYYYRVSCTHYAKEKGLFGKSQSEDNVSDSVWVP